MGVVSAWFPNPIVHCLPVFLRMLKVLGPGKGAEQGPGPSGSGSGPRYQFHFVRLSRPPTPAPASPQAGGRQRAIGHRLSQCILFTGQFSAHNVWLSHGACHYQNQFIGFKAAKIRRTILMISNIWLLCALELLQKLAMFSQQHVVKLYFFRHKMFIPKAFRFLDIK